MSAVSRVGFLRNGLTLVVFKDAGIRPEVREELMRVVMNSRTLLVGLEKGGGDQVKGAVSCGVVRQLACGYLQMKEGESGD